MRRFACAVQMFLLFLLGQAASARAEREARRAELVGKEQSSNVCDRWLEEGRDFVEQRKLLAAQDALNECLAARCGEAMKRECSRELERVREKTPHLVVSVSTEKGAPLDRALVWIDGQQRAPGIPVPLDPGDHVLRADEDAHLGVVRHVRLSMGERRILPVTLRAPADLPDELRRGDARTEWLMPEAAWVLTGLGGGALVTALALDGVARSGVEELKKCVPECSGAHVEGVARQVHWSRMAAGVGLVSLATAGWLALAESPSDALNGRWSAPKLEVSGGYDELRATLGGSFEEVDLVQ